MKALRLEAGELRFVPKLPPPDLPQGEALVRVLIAGICNTDLELARGYYPFEGVLGHEFVGVVERLGDGVSAAEASRLMGKRVVGEINAVCGVCEACSRGFGTHCEKRTVLGILGRDGAFAEFLTLPAPNLHPVPDDLPTEAAVFTEPLAAALRIQEQVPIGPSDRVLVVGAGKLGMLIAQTLAGIGCDLTVVTRRGATIPELLRARGAAVCLEEDVENAGFDVAVECTGNPAGFGIARRALRPRGTLVLKSTYAGRLEVDASALVVDEITVIGSRCGPFAPALRLLEEGGVDVTALVAARYPLEEGAAAFEHASRPGVLKVLLEIEGE
jgi:threonine dehydrogenase-like Zn-dependent dehydrogenase